MDGKKEIVKILNSMSGRYSGYEIFSDWIRCLALSIEQSTHMIRNKDWQDREQAYLDTIHAGRADTVCRDDRPPDRDSGRRPR